MSSFLIELWSTEESYTTVLLLIPSVGPSSNTKKLFFNYQYEMMNYYQHQKLQHF